MAAFNFEKKTVKWLLEDDGNYEREDHVDGTNWFQVWKRNDVIHVSATQWYHPRGDFCMRITDVSPDQAVALAERCAYNANDMIDGNTGLETIT